MSDEVGVRVRPEVLTATAAAIDDATYGISSDGMSGLPADAVGHGELATALADFGDEWGRGVQQMAGDAQRFVIELHATAADYQREEDEIARSFSDTTGSGD